MDSETIYIIAIGVILFLIFKALQALATPPKEGDKLAELSDTGIYFCRGKEILPLNELPDGRSISAICRSMMYGENECHSLLSANHNLKKTEFIVFEKKSLQPIFFSMKDKKLRPSYNMMVSELKDIDWAREKTNFDL